MGDASAAAQCWVQPKAGVALATDPGSALEDGDYRGAIAALVVHFEGAIRGAMVAGFTPTDARFYQRPEMRRVIRELAVDMQRGVFMREGGSEFFTVFQDQTFNCGVRAINLGKQMQPSLTARLRISVGKETAKSFSYDWNLNPGEEKNFEQPCKSDIWPKKRNASRRGTVERRQSHRSRFSRSARVDAQRIEEFHHHHQRPFFAERKTVERPMA